MLRFSNKRFFAPENEEGGDAAEGDEPIEGDENLDPEEGDEPAEGDEGQDSEEGDEPAEGDEPPVSRKETRVQKLANEARTERERRIAAEARAEALEAARAAPAADTTKDSRIREEKLSLMDPAERREFERDEELKSLRQGQQLTQIQLADYSDKATYETKAASNPVYAKHKDWVESTLIAERKAGRNPSRELLLRVKIGDEALNAKPKNKQEKKAAAERVNSVKAASVSGRSDAGTKKTGKGDSLEALEARLKNVVI